MLLGLVTGPVEAQAPDVLDERCVVSAFNRSAPVQADGSWVLPNVPATLGPTRVRATCIREAGTVSGQSELVLVPVDQVISVPEIVFEPSIQVPQRLELSAPTTTLSAIGATVQLSVVGVYGDGTTSDLSAADTGTAYRLSNPAVATISADGQVTAVRSGILIISASHEGALGLLRLEIVTSGDSDGDGIPDDFEIANGLDPNNPDDALGDLDGDGLSNLQEFQMGLDLRAPDTDGDSLLDGDEGPLGTNPLLFDTDGDGLSDGLEVQMGTDPLDPDDFDLANALTAFTVAPGSFNLVFNTVLSEASTQLVAEGTLIDGSVVDLTRRGTRYVSSDLTVCSFGAEPGRVFAGADGNCTITASNSGFDALATGTVSSFSPIPLSALSLPGATHNVDVAGDFAYVANDSVGLSVVDVANRNAPALLTSVDTPGTALDVRVVEGIAYVADGSRGLSLFDLTEPAAPVLLANFDTPGEARDVEVRNGLAYVADGIQGLHIVDVSDPTTPMPVGSIGALGTLGAIRGVDVATHRGLAVLAAGTVVQVVDVSTPAAPTLLGTASLGGFAEDVVVRQGFAHVADLENSLTVVDLRDPVDPIVGISTPAATGGLLTDVVRRGDLLFGSDIFFVNGVPILSVSLPELPTPTAILDFSSFGDDNGTGIAVDDQFVYLTTDDRRLILGRYLSLQDSTGISPVVALTAPDADLTPLAGSPVQVVAEASDDVAVLRVDFLVGGEVASIDFTHPYEVTLNIPTGEPTITLGARAVDYGNNLGEAEEVDLTVEPDVDEPVLTDIEPSPGALLNSGDALTVRATASDNVAVQQVAFEILGRVLVDTAEPYEVTLSAPFVTQATEVPIRISASDPSGNEALAVTTLTVLPVTDFEPPLPVFLAPSDGEPVPQGTEVTVDLAITDNLLIDTYTLTLDGDVVGREFFIGRSSFTDQVVLTLPEEAPAGQTFTLRLEATDFGGNTQATELSLIAVEGLVVTGDRILDSTLDGQSLILGPGTFTVGEPLDLRDLTLLPGAVVVTPNELPLVLDLSGTLRVARNSRIDVVGRGFAGGNSTHPAGFAPDFVIGSEPDAGGSHGGAGIVWRDSGPAGEAYGSVYVPRHAGSGGSRNPTSSRTGTRGGGAVDIAAAAVVLDGQILARNETSSFNSGRPAGAGGSVLLRTGSLDGTGLIDVSGGSTAADNGGLNHVGAGGGGRVALYADSLGAFDPRSQVRAQGGSRRQNSSILSWAGPGTLLVSDASSVYGSLIIDSGEEGNGADRTGPPTELPALGEGPVTAFLAEGNDAWVTAEADFLPRWHGAWMSLRNGVGNDLGAFQVLELDALGRALLADAGDVVGVTHYAGEYRFDSIELIHGAGLWSYDPLFAETVTTDGAARLPVQLEVVDLVVGTGSVVTVGHGTKLELHALDTIVVETGGSIDLSGLGFSGGDAGNPTGDAPGMIPGSEPDAGGSHGGTGIVWNGPGPAGSVYDSVYEPHLAGAGGAKNESNDWTGTPGGGVIHLQASTLVLDGELRARGLGSGFNSGRAGGAGGSVLLRVGTLRGSGSIDVSGVSTAADNNGARHVGSGGGGRVAIHAEWLDGFDPLSQVRALGGSRKQNSTILSYAAPGTILVTSETMPLGHLILDSGEETNGVDRVGAATELPMLGAGPIVGFEVAGSDAWVRGIEDFLPRWRGAWMNLLDDGEAVLGSFRVRELDALGRALLADAGTITEATSFRGEYRFDSIDLVRGAGLQAIDPVITGAVAARGAARLPPELTADELTIHSGSVTGVATGSSLALSVQGLMTIEAGARLDLSGRGFAGGTASHPDGFAPDFVTPARTDAGGSHGGNGVVWTAAGPPGEVYDSVYVPSLAGAGGARDEDGRGDGTAGGGVVILDVGELVLDGEIRVRPPAHSFNSSRPAGAGGTVLVRAIRLSGHGVIDASGESAAADNNGAHHVGVGGGGRVALHVDQLDGFDPVTQVQVRGGHRRQNSSFLGYAAPGTLYIAEAEANAGRLIVDNGAGRPGPATRLPRLGGGGLVALEVQGADAWITGPSSFRPRWLGAWMALFDAGGVELGVFRVLSIDTSGRVLLAEAATTAPSATSWEGRYRFDHLELHNGSTVATEDPLEILDP